tara:strand:- start:1128 stop:2459 length:1332 start_codon:yes stop_codon:yes gene_type:complete
MATPNIVPRGDQEGGLGTASLSWGKLFIENPAAGGTAAVTISNLDVDKFALDINANNTTANAVDISAIALQAASVMYVDTSDLGRAGRGYGLHIDDDLATEGGVNWEKRFIEIDSERTGQTQSGDTYKLYGLKADLKDSVDMHAAATTEIYGVSCTLDIDDADGTNKMTGIELKVGSDGTADAATTTGIELTTTDGATDIKMLSHAQAADYATIATSTNGATTITTVDGVGAAAHFEVEADGNITLDPAGTIALEAATVVTGAVTGTNYRTIYVDAGSMVPSVTNGADAGTEESSSHNVMSDFFAFDTSTDEYAQFKLVMPEQWDAATNIKAKFYWKPASSTTTSHDVQWGIQATAHADGGTIDSAWGTAATAVTDNVLGTAAGKVHISAASGACTIAGSPAEGQLVYFRVFRDVSGDDLNEDAHLLGVNIQYQESSTASAAW